MFTKQQREIPNEHLQLETKGAIIDVFSFQDILNSEVNLTNSVLFDRNVAGRTITEVWIKHPYKSPTLEMSYGESHFLDLAQEVSQRDSLDKGMPNGTVLMRGDKVIGFGANGSTFHDLHGCERKRLGIPTGQGYELCEGCSPKNHSEPKSIQNALSNYPKEEVNGSTAYLYGHWWCCQDCCDAMEKAGIKTVTLSRDWTLNYLGIEKLLNDKI